MGSESVCHGCGRTAVVRVRGPVNTHLVCEAHRVAIVKRIEGVALKLGRGGPNAQAILGKMLDNLTFEDLQ